jgi:hypothetical protein
VKTGLVAPKRRVYRRDYPDRPLEAIVNVFTRVTVTGAAVLAFVLLGPTGSANAEEVEFPAGEFCPGFAVLGSFTVKGSEKTLPGVRLWEHNVGTGILTNADTGRTFTQRSQYTSVETFDTTTNEYRRTINGRFMVGISAGQVGPDGPVTEDKTYSLTGHQTFTYDVDTDAAGYYFSGTIFADVCAVLAGED